MRDNITKEELRKIYYQNTNEEAAKKLDVSKVTLIKMIADAGIEPKGKGYAQKYLVV